MIIRAQMVKRTETSHGWMEVGKIITTPHDSLLILRGEAVPIDIPRPEPTEPPPTPATEEPQPPAADPDKCMAIKVGATVGSNKGTRICSAPLRSGLDGRRWCSDPACQVPEKPKKDIKP